MINKPSEEELRSIMDEGQTLYQISRQFNTTIPEIFKLGRSYGISFAYDHNNIPKPTKQDLESMYIVEGMTQKQIGKEFGVQAHAISVWLSKYNIQARVPMPPEYELEKMHTYEGMTQEQIGSEFGVHYATVGNWLRYYNISTAGRQGVIVPIPPKDDLISCIDNGLNQYQIAENYKVCNAIIFKWCEHYGIPGMVNNFRCTTDEHINWKYTVFDRDHRTCQKCGATNTPMQAHHIVPYCDHPEIAYDIENGITLCKNCHEFIRGYEYDYIEQFAAITQSHLMDQCIGDNNYE